MTFHVPHLQRRVIAVGLVVGTLLGLWAGTAYIAWTRGFLRAFEEVTTVQERGWNAVARTLAVRQRDAELDRLLGKATATECYETLYDLERPLPLLTALQRATRESECLTASFKAQLPRQSPAKLPAGQVRAQPIAWSPSWMWLTGHPVNREPLLSALGTSFPRLDLVVEYPFGGSQGAWVTLGGCLASGAEVRYVRKFLYDQKGVAVVFDNTSRTPEDPLTPGYVDSVCQAGHLHDGRQVAKWLMTPQRAEDPQGAARVPLAKLIPDPSHRQRVRRAMEVGEALEARGVHALAMALQEIHKVLYQPMWKGITPQERLSYAKMMFDVWARMPAPGTEE